MNIILQNRRVHVAFLEPHELIFPHQGVTLVLLLLLCNEDRRESLPITCMTVECLLTLKAIVSLLTISLYQLVGTSI
jgi:hypothetical protein